MIHVFPSSQPPLLLSFIKVGVSGFLAGRPANRCWFVKPEKAQRDSWMQPRSLAYFPPQAHFVLVWALCRTEWREIKWPNLCLRSNCWGEAGATGPCSHSTNHWLIRANYNTSTLKRCTRDRSQIPHLRNCVFNEQCRYHQRRWSLAKNPFGGGAQSTSLECTAFLHNGTNRFIIWLVISPSLAQLMNQTFHRHSSVGLNRSGY